MLRYLFVDMNSFFASVEQQEQPRLRERPIAVVPTMTTATCCIAASYEAKAMGVTTGTNVGEALARCPGIQLVEARPKVYVEYHHRIHDSIESCLHVDHVCSIDEMYGKLMGEECRPENAAALAHRVKQAIKKNVGDYVCCSIGIGPNSWLAKVASDMKKPDGMTMIPAEHLPEALYSLKLRDLPGVGRNMELRFNQYRIFSIQQLYELSVEKLSTIWGSKVIATQWWQKLRGYDIPFQATHRGSVSHSHVLPPEMRTHERAHSVMVRLIDKAAIRMRQMEFWAGCLSVAFRYTIPNPEADRQFSSGQPDAQSADRSYKARIHKRWEQAIPLGLCRDTLTMLELFDRAWPREPLGTPYKVSMVLSNLVSDKSATVPLFEEQCRRNELADTMDEINEKFGHHAVHFGSMFGARKSAPPRIAFGQIPELEEFEPTE